MSSAASPAPGRLGAQESARLLDQFDQAWRTGRIASIAEFLRSFTVQDPAAHRRLLEELVKIDLEYRWRKPGQERRCLEDYVRHHPELGPVESLPVELIGWEYRVRRRWGDRPSHDSYRQRFPRQRLGIDSTLARLDVELAADQRASQASSRAHEEVAVPFDGAPPAAAQLTAKQCLASLRDHGLLSPAQLNELKKPTDARALARELLQRNWLTAYQVNQLLLGRGADLVLGSYLVIERLGDGGSGQVFKALHRKMQRHVVVKLLRRELVADEQMLGRFYREMQVLSRVSHSNLVHALDAGPIGTAHVLVMEYVDGIDLSRLVKEQGPLPVAVASEYIRQAALGLQHIHERGLVHRDIKPSNLLITRGHGERSAPVVKVLDLGLARLQHPAGSQSIALDKEVTRTLTPEGAVVMMGTPDYLAPEQALDFHGADIRADIYGLGCTLYYLLTGRAPFAGGTMAQKLMRHQQENPPDVQQACPDLPAGLAPVLAKMMAKRREDRYQTPAEVAAALARFAQASARFPRRSRGRLILALGGLVLAGLALALVLVGYGLRSPKSPASAAHHLSAAEAFQQLLARKDRAPADLDELCKEVLNLRMHYPGTPEAQRAAELLAELPSPLDRLPGQPGKTIIVWARESGSSPVVTVSPDGKLIACGISSEFSSQFSIGLWEPATDKKRNLERAHASSIRALVFSPDGKTLASGSTDGAVRWWEVAGGNRLANLDGLKTDTPLLAFSPDGRILAFVGPDNAVTLWDTATQQQRTLVNAAHLRSMKFAPDGRTLATASKSGLVRTWDIATGKQLAAIELPLCSIVGYSPDARFLALSVENAVQLWDLAAPAAPPRVVPHSGNPVGFTPDGNRLVFMYTGNWVVLVDAASGKEASRWPVSDKKWGWMGILAPDGRHLVTTNHDYTVSVFRLAPAVKR